MDEEGNFVKIVDLISKYLPATGVIYGALIVLFGLLHVSGIKLFETYHIEGFTIVGLGLALVSLGAPYWDVVFREKKLLNQEKNLQKKPVTLKTNYLDLIKEKIAEKVESGEMELDELKQFCFGYLFELYKQRWAKFITFLFTILAPLIVIAITAFSGLLQLIINLITQNLFVGTIASIIILAMIFGPGIVSYWLFGKIFNKSLFLKELHSTSPIDFYFEMKNKIKSRKSQNGMLKETKE